MESPDLVQVKSSDAAYEIIALDRKTGAFEIRGSGGKAKGFGHIVDGTAFAVYSENGELVLQCGSRRWNLSDPPVKLSVERSTDGMVNTFRVDVNGRNEFVVRYRSALADPLNRADVSFGPMDEEAQDFFLWVARAAPDSDWVTNSTRNWGAGIES